VVPGIYVRRNISATDWKELSPTVAKICSYYFNVLVGKESKMEGSKAKISKEERMRREKMT
jgi:hypothetical protein